MVQFAPTVKAPMVEQFPPTVYEVGLAPEGVLTEIPVSDALPVLVSVTGSGLLDVFTAVLGKVSVVALSVAMGAAAPAVPVNFMLLTEEAYTVAA